MNTYKTASKIIFFFGFAFSQFYWFDSGRPQVYHFFLMVFSFFIIIKNLKKFNLNRFGLQYLNLFLIYSTLVNLIYSLVYFETAFLVSSLYIAFNYIIHISIIYGLIQKSINIEAVRKSAYYSVVLMCLYTLLGYGKYLNIRYIGCFNDPNQLAFWVLCSYSIIKIKNLTFKKNAFLLFIVSFLIVKTLSRSAFISLIMINIEFIVRHMGSKKLLIKATMVLMIFLTLYIVHNNYGEIINCKYINRVASTDFEKEADVRGYNRVTENPRFILLGHGQGLDDRFFESATEIHSTWAGILFYYGIISLILVIAYVLRIQQHATILEKLIFFSPMIYSFFTYGFRNSIFWIYLAVWKYFYIQKKSR